SSRRRHTRSKRDWSSDVCSSDLQPVTLAPGSVVEVRDEEWLVTGVQTVYERANHQEVTPSSPVQRIEVQGLSELVRDTTAVFSEIGRAACRERVWIWEVERALTN